jgi:site-specific DNA-cytosine methylase
LGNAAAEVLAAYSGSNADRTRALYAKLSALGPAGEVAVNLLRSCKTSERAKVYRRRSSRGAAYDTKGWAMDNLCRLLGEHAGALGVGWGWGEDAETPGFPWVLYVELSDGVGQVSFHAAARGEGPAYGKPWDGAKGVSGQRACSWAATLLERAVGPPPPAAGPPKIKAATLFSGIGAPEVACPDWEWLWHAEVESFPCAVMKARHPESVNLGDVNAEDFVERATATGKPDVIVWGSPCQSFSVAGKRLGLDDPRGNLTLLGIKRIGELKPKYSVWENVPGVLSDEDGLTIQTVVELFTQIGYICDIDIWDAQWGGVPQRRRRVFIVCARLDDLLQKRTPTSERIAADLLVQALLATWDAALEASSPRRSPSVSEPRIGVSESSANAKMRSLDALSGGSAVTRLLAFWADSQMASGVGDKNIASSQRQFWGDLWSKLRGRTTSTSTEATTPNEICTFAEMSLIIVRSIITSPTSSLSQPWSSDYWSLAFFALTIMKEIIAYAGSASCELFSTSELRSRWWACLNDANSCFLELERYIGNWATSEQILSLAESLRWNPAPGREAGEGVAPTISARPTAGGGLGTDFDLDGGLIQQEAFNNQGHGWWDKTDAAQTVRKGDDGGSGGARESTLVVAPPLNAGMGRRRGSGAHGDPLVSGAVSAKWSKGTGGPSGDECYNLVAFDYKAGGETSFAVGRQAGALRGDGHGGGHAAIAFQTRVARNGRGGGEDVVPALNGADAGATSDMRPCVAVFKPSHFTRDKDAGPSDIVPPLTADADKGDQDPVLMDGVAVRRLTPRECARLQGFPDNHLDITFRGKPAADGPKYKALGNAMCVKEVRWILRRIEKFEREVRK